MGEWRSLKVVGRQWNLPFDNGHMSGERGNSILTWLSWKFQLLSFLPFFSYYRAHISIANIFMRGRHTSEKKRKWNLKSNEYHVLVRWENLVQQWKPTSRITVVSSVGLAPHVQLLRIANILSDLRRWLEKIEIKNCFLLIFSASRRSQLRILIHRRQFRGIFALSTVKSFETIESGRWKDVVIKQLRFSRMNSMETETSRRRRIMKIPVIFRLTLTFGWQKKNVHATFEDERVDGVLTWATSPSARRFFTWIQLLGLYCVIHTQKISRVSFSNL